MNLFQPDPELRRLDFGSFRPSLQRPRVLGPSVVSARKGRANGIQHSRLIRAGTRGVKLLDALLSARWAVEGR